MYSEQENIIPIEHYDEEVYSQEEEVVEEDRDYSGEQEEVEEVDERETLGEAGSSLLDRLWTTKVVSWDNTPDLPSTIDEEVVDPVRILKEGDDSALRHSALFVASTGFGSMSTSTILNILSEAFESAVEPILPQGLEWIDDEHVVILWSNGAREAFLHLTGQLLDEDYPLELIRSCPLGGNDATVRLALASDVKIKGAAAKSKFYRARQESHKPYSTSGRRPRARKDELDAELDAIRGPQASKDDLDAELDAMAEGRREEL